MNGSRGLMGIEPPGYSGVILLGQMPIMVRGGMFQMKGKRFYVSDKGEVTDENDQEIAMVKNGRLMPMQGQQPPQQRQQQPEGAE